MTPKIDPGELFWTSGGTLARQAATRKDKGQENVAKPTQDRPKSAKKPF